MTIPQEKQVFVGKIALGLLSKFSDYKASLQAAFPDIYADLESAASNPNCSCRSRVEQHLNSNRDKAIEITNNFLADKDNDARALEVINVDYFSLAPKAYGGKMFEIANTSEAYAAFHRSLLEDRASYRQMSTSVSGDRLFIYFS